MKQNNSSESYENYTEKEENEGSLVPTRDFDMVSSCGEDGKIEKEKSFKSTMIPTFINASSE